MSFFNKLLFFLAILACLAASASFAVALGVSPGRVTLKYEPNYVYEREVCYTPGAMPVLEIKAEGPFANDITFLNVDEDNLLDLRVEGCLKYRFKMPPNFNIPGTHRTKIYAIEVPPEDVSGFFVARVSIEHQLDVIIPYPGKYLEIIEFRAENVEAGNEVPIYLSFINRGNETVNEAQGVVTIYNHKNETLGSVKTKVFKNIEPDKQRDVLLSWNSTPNKQGNYYAKLRLSYDGFVNNASSSFKLGGLDVSLINYTSEVIIGGIRDFYLIVDSIWSETVRGVYCKVNVYNYSLSQEPVTSFETLVRSIPPWGTEIIKGKIDTTNLNLGVYDMKITLFFEDMKKDYEGKLSVVKEPPKPKEKKKTVFDRFASASTLMKVTVIALIIVLLAAIAFLVYLIVPKKRKEV